MTGQIAESKTALAYALQALSNAGLYLGRVREIILALGEALDAAPDRDSDAGAMASGLVCFLTGYLDNAEREASQAANDARAMLEAIASKGGK